MGPYGSWSVELKNAGPTRSRGVVHKLKLKLYGTFSNRRQRELATPYDTIAEKIQQQGSSDELSEDKPVIVLTGKELDGFGGRGDGGRGGSGKLGMSSIVLVASVLLLLGL